MNLLETFLKDVDRDKKPVKYMSKQEFNDFLIKKGFIFPKKAKKTLSGLRYTTVFGTSSYLNPKRIFALVIYTPKNNMKEDFYHTPEEAAMNAPVTGLWQVINMVTGEVMYDPFNRAKVKTESKKMTLIESYLQHLNEMEIRGINKTIENPDQRPNYIGMCLNEMPSDRMKIKCLRKVKELTAMNPFYQHRIDRFIDAINNRYEPTQKAGFNEYIRGSRDEPTYPDNRVIS
jgi:hypothetical protein